MNRLTKTEVFLSKEDVEVLYDYMDDLLETDVRTDAVGFAFSAGRLVAALDTMLTAGMVNRVEFYD